MLRRSVLVVLLPILALIAVPGLGAPVPSKTSANESLAARDADLATVRDFVASKQVATVLADRGLTQEQVNQKIAQLSPQDLHQLAQNLDQLKAAGLNSHAWFWIEVIGLLTVALIIFANGV